MFGINERKKERDVLVKEEGIYIPQNSKMSKERLVKFRT